MKWQVEPAPPAGSGGPSEPWREVVAGVGDGASAQDGGSLQTPLLSSCSFMEEHGEQGCAGAWNPGASNQGEWGCRGVGSWVSALSLPLSPLVNPKGLAGVSLEPEHSLWKTLKDHRRMKACAILGSFLIVH